MKSAITDGGVFQVSWIASRYDRLLARHKAARPIGSGLSDRSIGALPVALLHKTRSLLRFSNNRPRNSRRVRDGARNSRTGAHFDAATKPFVLRTRPLVTNRFPDCGRWCKSARGPNEQEFGSSHRFQFPGL